MQQASSREKKYASSVLTQQITRQNATPRSTSISGVTSAFHLDGEEWDLSNLCFNDDSSSDVQNNETRWKSSSSSQIQIQNTSRTGYCCSKLSLRDSNLYPTSNDVKFDQEKLLKSIEEIFYVNAHQSIIKQQQKNMLETKRTSRREDLDKKVIPPEESESRVGAFAKSGGATTTKSSYYKAKSRISTSPKKIRPPPPTWVSDDTSLQEKFDRKKTQNASRECHRSTGSTSSSRERSVSPIFSVSSNDSAFSSDDEELITRPEIEIIPGKLLPLRGAVETMRAINNGTSRVVSCLVCQIALHCIQDAEMVICPDCRNISSVVLVGVNGDDVLRKDTTSSVSMNQYEKNPEEDYSYARKDRRKGNVGGVGLGLKASDA